MRRAEAAQKIDIRHLKKHGVLESGGTGTLFWRNEWCERTSSISYTLFDDDMWLRYSSAPHGHERRDMSIHVPIVKTECNYGGHRKWFRCPQCNARVGILYAHWYHFVCRSCAGVKHSSNLEGLLDRMTRKSRRLQRRLDPDGVDDDFYHKPKGMHWKTFDSLVDADRRLQEAIDIAFLHKFGMML